MTIKDINEKIISDARIQADKIVTQAEDNANNIIKKNGVVIRYTALRPVWASS